MEEQLEALRRQLEELGVPAARVRALKDAFDSAAGSTERQNAALDNMRSVIENVQNAAAFANETFADLTAILQANLDEINNNESAQKRVTKATKGIIDLSRELSYHEGEISDYSEKQLAKKIELAEQRKRDTEEASAAIQREHGLRSNASQATLDMYFDRQKALLRERGLADSLYQRELQKLENDQAILNQRKADFDIMDGVIQKAKAQLAVQKQVNEKMGVAGGLVKGLAGAMSKLGIEGSALQHSIEDANTAMKKAAKDGGSKLKVALIGIGEVAKGAFKTLNDPVFIFGGIAAAALEGDKHITDMQRSLGLSYDNAYDLTVQLEAAANASGDVFITTSRLTHAVAALTEQTGVFATTFDNANLALYAQLTDNLGIAGENAGNLVTTLQLSGESAADFESNLEDSVNSFNKANKTGVTLKSVLGDISNASSALQVTLGKTPGALAEAATAARGIGLELSKVEKIASSLLDFESSIEAELQAQLLTGNSMNLARAREAALMGDMKTVSEEIGKQQAVQQAFATNNVIAQQSVAKSLGISRDELAQMYKQQQLATLGAAKFAAKYGEQELAAIKARNAQQELGEAISKIKDYAAQIFLPLAKAVGFVAEGIASIVANPISGFFVKAAVRGLLLFKTITSLGGAIKGAGKMLTGFQDSWKTITGLFKSGSKAAQAATDTISNTASKAAEQASQAGKKASSPGGGMIEKFNKLDTKSLLRGAAAMVVLSAALYISAKAFQEFATVEWKSVAMGLTGMIGLAAVAKIISKGSKDMILGAAAIGILGLAMIPLANALNQMANVKIEGVLAAAAGLVIFSAAAFALGALFSSGAGAVLFGAGLLGIMALAVAIEPLGKALTSAAPGFAAFGNAMESLTMESAKALAVTGVGLIALAGGLISLSAASLLGSPLGTLSELAALAPGLATVGTSLTAIAAGIAALSSALNTLQTEKLDEIKDLVITTAFAAPAIAATGAITELINGITGNDDTSENKKLLEKVDRLIAAVETRQNIYLNPGAIEEAIVLGSEKF